MFFSPSTKIHNISQSTKRASKNPLKSYQGPSLIIHPAIPFKCASAYTANQIINCSTLTINSLPQPYTFINIFTSSKTVTFFLSITFSHSKFATTEWVELALNLSKIK